MTKPCKFCDRKTIEKLPEKVFTIRCGGKDCEHRVLYGLEKEDCRQVILKTDKKQSTVNFLIDSVVAFLD